MSPAQQRCGLLLRGILSGEVIFGAVRSGRLDLGLSHADLSKRRVRFELTQRDGVKAIEREWPTDFVITPVSGGHEGRLSLGAADDFAPFSRLTVKNEAGKRYRSVRDFFLTSLFGFTAEECFGCFAKSSDRTPDAETLAFACRQVRDHYFDDPVHRNMISVIFAYRALDFGDQTLLEEAAAWLENELADDPSSRGAPEPGGKPRTHHHRVDAIHQRVSMSMTLWMVYLSLGEIDRMAVALDQAIAFMRSLSEPHGLHALNGVRMFLMRAYLHHLRGESDKAVELAGAAFAFNSQCFAVAEPDLRTFREMKASYHAATLALLLIRVEKAGENMPVVDTFDAVHRLRDKTGLKRLKTQFLRMAGVAQPVVTAPAPAPAAVAVPAPAKLSRKQRLAIVRARRMALFAEYESLNGAGTVLIGDSLIDYASWNLLLPHEPTRNFGIRGDTAETLFQRCGDVLKVQPKRILLVVGANDILERRSLEEAASWVARTVDHWRAAAPACQIIMHGVLPLAKALVASVELNDRLRRVAEARDLPFLNATGGMLSEAGVLTPPWTKDGVHLLARGYHQWVDNLRPELTGLGVDARPGALVGA